MAEVKPKECGKCGARFPTDPDASAEERDAEAAAHAESFHPAPPK